MALHGKHSPLPVEPVVHEVVAGHAREHPHRVALTCGWGQSWTFRQLDERANQLARFLRDRGVSRSSVVGVCLDRTPNLVVAILGILKAGAAYLPLDPAYPSDRLRLISAQVSRMSLTVVGPETRELVTAVEHCDLTALSGRLDELPTTAPEVWTRGDDLCYVVCTSGSTGSPKAVAIEHGGWYNLLAWLRDEYRLGHNSSGLLVSPFGFDLTQRALMLPLFVGATLHLLPSRHFDPLLAYRLVDTLSPAMMHCAPSTFYLLVEGEDAAGGGALARLGHVFLGGEPPSAGRIAAWAKLPGNRCSVVNVYGVAECTDISTAHTLVDYDAYSAGSVPAGRPIHNTQVIVVGNDLAEVPDGEVGEICVTGVGVGPGYLDPAPAYCDRFVTVERDGEDVRLHRTGDRGYVSRASDLMVVGRVDSQVKVHGMRIDIGDVEVAVRCLPQVRDAAVLALPGGDDLELVAAVVPAHARLEVAALRSDLSTALPQAMLPRLFVEVAEFPLNPNGKIDRSALADQLRARRTDIGSEKREPAPRTERGVLAEQHHIPQKG